MTRMNPGLFPVILSKAASAAESKDPYPRGCNPGDRRLCELQVSEGVVFRPNETGAK